MRHPQKRVLLGGYLDDQFSEDALRFRLTYDGPLPSTPKDARTGQPVRNAALKHGMRRHFHAQLKRLWQTHPALAGWHLESYLEHRRWRYDNALRDFQTGGIDLDNPEHIITPEYVAPRREPAYDVLGRDFNMFGFNFVPLVWADVDILCSIGVLFLRRGRPGNLFSEGDVDNRMKTLVDCLRRPASANEITDPPQAGEHPFFVLLDDDKYLSGFSVETDDLLDPLGDDFGDHSQSKLIISVELKPWKLTMMNSHLT